jgi:hypothetical protein
MQSRHTHKARNITAGLGDLVRWVVRRGLRLGLVGGLCFAGGACDSDQPATCGDGSVADGMIFDQSIVIVSVMVNSCPNIRSLSASPMTAPVGGTIRMSGDVVDRDVGDALAFIWSASAGQFSSLSTIDTAYTCLLPGVQTLNLRASDGKCDTMTSVNVTCL